jgi:hypothetical protein
VFAAIAAVVFVNAGLGILFATGWALFVTPVLGLPMLAPLHIVGVVLILFSLRFYLSPRVSNVNVNMGSGSNALAEMLKKLPKDRKNDTVR